MEVNTLRVLYTEEGRKPRRSNLQGWGPSRSTPMTVLEEIGEGSEIREGSDLSPSGRLKKDVFTENKRGELSNSN